MPITQIPKAKEEEKGLRYVDKNDSHRKGRKTLATTGLVNSSS